MTALPTRKLEQYRYADIDALASVWSDLAPPESIAIAARDKLRQIWLPGDQDVQVRRVAMTLEAGASASIFALNTARVYGRIELDVTMHEGVQVTTPARSIVDAAAAGTGPEHIHQAVRQALERAIVSPQQLQTAASRRGYRHRRTVEPLIERALVDAIS